jgi:hypothetical protein
MTPNRPQHPAWLFILLPATAMLLGWGLRGYIGGGPHGAMIPGTFVALSLAWLLGYKMETAAIAAVFGAVGVGQGGTETYGQTLGFVLAWDTLAWGVLGCAIKGAVWGLLGGAVLGLGLDRTHYDRETTILALLITIPAFIIGVRVFNAPQYPWLYFSNLLDRPRDESWAGLLLASIAILAYLRYRGTNAAFAIPLSFSLRGGLGGAIGFGGGCLWLAFGPPEILWVGWWKMMEFTFGFIFGAALGWCAWRHREQLHRAGQEGDTPKATWGPCIGLLAFVVLTMIGRDLVYEAFPSTIWKRDGLAAELVNIGYSAVFDFITFGAVVAIFGLFSLHAAWQAAITLMVYHTVLDYTRDLHNTDHFGYTLPLFWRQAIPALCAVLVGVLVCRLTRGPRAVERLLLLSIWTCYLSGCARSFFHKGLLFPAEGGGRFEAMFNHHTSLFVVHGIFTASAILTTWFVLRKPQSEAPDLIAN